MKYKKGDRVHSNQFAVKGKCPWGMCMIVKWFEHLSTAIVLSEHNGKEYTVII